MELTYWVLMAVSIGAFLWYGVACLFFEAMVEEFDRFGLARFRRLTGVLEILGGLGLVAGLLAPPLVIPAAGGLAILMALGVATRVRVRDSLLETLPALLLFVANLYLALFAAGVLG